MHGHDAEKHHAELRPRLARVRAGREARRSAGVYDGLPTVPALFRQRDVLITGASGFLGRVLLEKLLRSCPDVGTVYLLLRPKKGVAPRDRVQAIVDVPLFDQVRREQPAALAKLVAVAGDCAELGLGLGAEDRALLRDRVAVVFHGAASVRFDDPVQKAVLLNTRGSRELVELFRGSERLQAFVHISTAYTNTNRTPIKELLYPTHIDWRLAVQAATDSSIAEVLDNLGHKFLDFHANTYTFSKALAEQVTAEAAASMPIIIVRPAVVIGACEEPLIGWLDNVNSPASMMMAANMGLIRVFNPAFGADVAQDYVPVDLVAKAIILAAWAKATQQDLQLDKSGDGSAPAMVNVAIADVHRCSNKLLDRIYHSYSRRQAPYASALRYPFVVLSRSRLEYYVYAFFYHILFGLTVDFILRLANKQPRLMKIYRKIEVVYNAVGPFASRSYPIDTSNLWGLQQLMHPSDEPAFDYSVETLNPVRDSVNQLVGILEYALKEKFDREKGLRHIDRLFWAEMVFYAFLAVILGYFLLPLFYQ